jgi:hypothetical protein
MIRTLTTFALTAFLTFQSLAQCHIFDLVATAGDCQPDGTFFVTLDFQFSNVGNQGFKVQGNGVNYGVFSYDDVPITIGPLPGNGSTNYEFGVKDVQFPDCHDVDNLGVVNCGSGDCEIFNLNTDLGPCNPDGSYKLWINFQYANAPNNHFDVIYDGEIIASFSLSQLPVFIQNFQDNGEAFPVIAVCINDTPDCCAEKEFEAPDCPPGGACDIFDMVVTAGDCVDGMFYVTLDFQYENVGDKFKVQGNGINYGVFSYNDLPIILGPLAGNGTTPYEFVVKDALYATCSEAVGLGAVSCPSTGDCAITQLVADPGDCKNDGSYNLTIDFNVSNSSTNFFKVLYNGAVILSNIPISSLPKVIENFKDNGEPFPAITVCLNDQPNCCAEVEFESPGCQLQGDCHIFDVIAEAHPCDNDGNFLVDIDFEFENVGDLGFTIFGNGVVYGNFSYDQNFWTIGPLAGNGTIYEFVIKDKANPDCKGFTHIGPIYCDDACHIFDLHAETSECDDDGQFYVTLDFEFDNVGDQGFKVGGNGNVYGIFSYDDLPIVLGPFESTNQQLEFFVKDVAHPVCHDFVVVEAPDCDSGGGCSITDLTANVHPCLGDGTFYVSLDFEHQHTGSLFKVQGNGIVYGYFSYDHVPLSIGPLVGNGTTPYEFVVIDVNHPDCHASVEVGTMECASTGSCQIFDVIADPGACHDDGTYNLWIYFDFENAGNNFFDVYYNGELVGFFPLANVPVIIPHFHDNGDPTQEITICINDDPNCCATAIFDAPDCNTPNLVWPGDANADNFADNFDLLNIGLAFGAQGAARTVKGIEWLGLQAENWNKLFANDLNYKHADCNGDGKITADDIQALAVNFGEHHGTIESPVLIGGAKDDPPFYVDLPQTMASGSSFSAPIILGSEDKPVKDAYGVAFTLKFDPGIIKPSSVQLQYDPSWLGVMGVNLLTFDKTFANDGIIKVALVRNDHNNVSGFGQVAAFIGIIDNIAGKDVMTVEISNVRAIKGNESLIPLYKPTEVTQLVTGTGDVAKEPGFEVYPVPTTDMINLRHPSGLQVSSIEIKDLDGKSLRGFELSGNHLNIGSLPAGVYVLKIEANGKFYFEKIVKF